MRKAVWLLLVGCKQEEDAAREYGELPISQALPGIEDACVGIGETDDTADGTIDRRMEHVSAERWDRVTTWFASGGTLIDFEERDERGDIVFRSTQAAIDGETSLVTWTTQRDEQGQVLVEIEDNSEYGVIRDEYSYDGELLDRIETSLDGVLAQTHIHRYDVDNRLSEEIIASEFGDGLPETRTRTYFEPWPSLDYHHTQDTNSDGLLETESDVFLDESGRTLLIEMMNHLSQVFSTTEYTYDAAGREIRKRYTASSEDGASEQETLTTYDDGGQPLRVESWQGLSGGPLSLLYAVTWRYDADDRMLESASWRASYGEELSLSSITTWTWSCPP